MRLTHIRFIGVIILALILQYNTAFGVATDHYQNIDPKVVEQVKRGIVTISNNVQKAAYRTPFQRNATGFVVDRSKGIILTNEHVASISLINDITLTFFNGKELEGKFIYNDPTRDFAFIKVDPSQLPKDIIELKFAKQPPKLQQQVFIVGNNEGRNFSVQTGFITGLYQTSGMFTEHCYTISLNTVGGSSGSPILNESGEVLALNFAGGHSSAQALNIQYVVDALGYIQDNKIPPRLGLGVLYSYYSLDKASKYGNFPKDLIEKYMKEYPDTFNSAVTVKQVLRSTPAYGILQPGDIIWSVNGNDMPSSLYDIEKVINSSDSKEVKLQIYRGGQQKSVRIRPYDLHKHTIKRMVMFGGAVFYEADEMIRILTGHKLGTVFITHADEGSTFSNLPHIYGLVEGVRSTNRVIQLNSLDYKTINNLDDLMKLIPSLIKKKSFYVGYTNGFFEIGYDAIPYANSNLKYLGVDYHNYSGDPKVLTFNRETLSWSETAIAESK